MIWVNTRKSDPPQNHNEQHTQTIRKLTQFRQEVRLSCDIRPDVIMELIDAVCSNTDAKSVVALSLNPCFRHQYTSVYDAIDHFFQASNKDNAADERRGKERQLLRLCVPYLAPPKHQKFWLFGLDVTPQPRPFANTLPDRTVVYYPNPVLSNKPINIGHQYAALVYFPEKESAVSPPWALPLSLRRVQSHEKAATVQAEQIQHLLSDETFAFHNQLCVAVVDSALSAITFLGPTKPLNNLVTIARSRSNRVFYRKPPKSATRRKKRGHPKWYGQRFDLKDKATWTAPDVMETVGHTTRRGRQLTIHLKGWHNLLTRGTREHAMHDHPFTLIRIDVSDAAGQPVFSHPLWLTVIGQRRAEISLKDAWDAYQRRYDVEHLFRFGKQRLLTTAYQTPDVEHEENFWQITQLAYVQLWLARELAESMPKPWERYLPTLQVGEASPAMVQRDFLRIIRQIEPPPALPKRRGKSPGRAKGDCQKRRTKQKVIKKGQKAQKRLKSAA